MVMESSKATWRWLSRMPYTETERVRVCASLLSHATILRDGCACPSLPHNTTVYTNATSRLLLDYCNELTVQQAGGSIHSLISALLTPILEL